MIYSHNKEYMFLRVPKTGSRSISQVLRRSAGGIDQYYPPRMLEDGSYRPHLHCTEVMDYLGETYWNRYFKFAFVRNPWDHMVSLWCLHAQIHKTVSSRISLGDYVFDHWEQYWEFLPHGFIYHEGKICVDFIGKLETIQQDCDKLAEILRIDPFTVPHKRSLYKRNREDYTVYYRDDTELINRVQELYGKDFTDRFNYVYGGENVHQS